MERDEATGAAHCSADQFLTASPLAYVKISVTVGRLAALIARRPMDHEVATQTHAVERYLLGEMPSSERDLFEEHYFSCADCGEEVRSASALMRDMKDALRDFKP